TSTTPPCPTRIKPIERTRRVFRLRPTIHPPGASTSPLSFRSERPSVTAAPVRAGLPRPSGGCATRHALHDVGIAVALRLRTLRRLRSRGHLEYAGALLALLADLHG